MNHLSLFSGIGGIDLAAEWAGMRTVAFVEQNKFCQQVLAKHWPGVPIHDDVRTVGAKDFAEPIHVISGGFPCQPFSHAGKQLGTEDDRHLWPEYLRLIKELKPSWVVGENVIGIEHLALDDVLASLESESYETRAFDIPACAVGARHQRRRFFIIGYSNRNGESARAKYAEMAELQGASRGMGANTNPECIRLQRRATSAAEGEEKSRDEQLSGFLQFGTWDEISEPSFYGSIDGLPDLAHRNQALGNAVVPQQIYPIMKAIAEIGL
jgi:DNA (cytosine-5)-methyltransferase 1